MTIDRRIGGEQLFLGDDELTLPQPTPTAPAPLNPNDPYDLQLLLGQAQLANLQRPPTVSTPSAAIPDPDLAAKQAFAKQQSEFEAEAQRRIQAESLAQREKESVRNAELQRQQLQLDQMRQAEQAADAAARRALEQGQLDESRRQFDTSQKLAESRFRLEQQVAREQYEQGQQEFAFGALKFLTDLARNPRTALASFFLNRGQTPPDQVGQTSPIPAGLNVTNVAETLPGFLQGILGAARQGMGAAGAQPSSAPAATAAGPAGEQNLVSALQGAGAVPPFLSRLLAQQQGVASEGTNMAQQTAVPAGVPLVSSIALLQMQPSEREGLRGLVEAGGMAWEDYLALVQRNSPQQQAQAPGAGVPQFQFLQQ